MTDRYDEMHDTNGNARAHYSAFDQWLTVTPPPRIEQKRREAEFLFHRVGITFAVYALLPLYAFNFSRLASRTPGRTPDSIQ